MSETKMKTCKECGKLFLPKFRQQKYCNEVHFRPCPVCGKLVEAKYLSDPARCCSGKCKAIQGKLNKGIKVDVPELTENTNVENSKVETVLSIPEEAVVKKYTGDSWGPYVKDNVYRVVINSSKGEHSVTPLYNVTTETEVTDDAAMIFTNKKKISTVFKSVKL